MARIIIWILLVILRLTSAKNTKTDLYKRCSQLEGHDCLEYQTYQCTAKKISGADNNRAENHCSDGCPTTPTYVHAEVYKKRIFNGGRLFPGVNVIWTIPPGGPPRRGFIVQFTSGTFFSYVDITQPTDFGEFRYDCFIPIYSNRTWTVSVYSVPFNPDSTNYYKSDVFTLDINGNQVFPGAFVASSPVTTTASTTTASTTTTSTTTATPTTSSTTATTAITAPKTLITTVKTRSTFKTQPFTSTLHNQNRSPSPVLSLPSTSSTSIYGITIGFLGAVVIIGAVLLCHLRQNWAKMRYRNCLKFCQQDVSESKSSEVVENKKSPKLDRRNVLMLYVQPRPEHQKNVSDLVTSLSKICHLNDINTMESLQSAEATSLREKVEEELNNAEMILLISSDCLMKVVHDLTIGAQNSDCTQTILALDILINAHVRYRSKIITAYFPSAKDLGILRGFSEWALVVLPRDLEALLSHVQDPKSSQLNHLELPKSRYEDFDFESIIEDEYKDRLYSLESGFYEQQNFDTRLPLAKSELSNSGYVENGCDSLPEVSMPPYRSDNSRVYQDMGNEPPNLYLTHVPQTTNNHNLTHAPPQNVGNHAPPQNVGYHAPPQNVGYHAPPQNVGNHAPPQNVGYHAPPHNVGNHAPPQNVGYHAPPQNVGNHAPPQNVGYHAPTQNVGYHAPPQNVGHHAPPQNVGNHAPSQNVGHHGITRQSQGRFKFHPPISCDDSDNISEYVAALNEKCGNFI